MTSKPAGTTPDQGADRSADRKPREVRGELIERLQIAVPSDDSYVIYSQCGAGTPYRLVIQFQHLGDMQAAHVSVVKSRGATQNQGPLT